MFKSWFQWSLSFIVLLIADRSYLSPTFQRLLVSGQEAISQNGSRYVYFILTNERSIPSNRTLCSFVSAAKHNPQYTVRVLLANKESIDLFVDELHRLGYSYDNNQTDKSISRATAAKAVSVDADIWGGTTSATELPNLRFELLDYLDIFRDTPISDWYTTGVYKEHYQFRHTHLSDASRFCLLYKHGGIYMDTDFISVKGMSHLPPSCLGVQMTGRINNAVLKFDKRDNPFLRACVHTFPKDYRSMGNNHAAMGPKLLDRVLKSPAYSQNGSVVGPTAFHRLPPPVFYPFDWRHTAKHFNVKLADNTNAVRRLRDPHNPTVGVHFWSAFARKHVGVKGSYMDRVMEQECSMRDGI